MSRKRRKHKINKSTFKETMCSKCGLCVKGINPKFCYTFLYKKNPGKFAGEIFPKIRHQNSMLKQIKTIKPTEIGNSPIAMLIFRAVFCTSNLCIGCAREDHDIFNCINRFKSQEIYNPAYKLIKQTFSNKGRLNKAQRKAIRKAQKAKKQKQNKPTVTTFMSDNEDFKAEVKRIIENNSRQPDKD